MSRKEGSFKKEPTYFTIPLSQILESQKQTKDLKPLRIPAALRSCSEVVLADLNNKNPLALCNLKSDKLEYFKIGNNSFLFHSSSTLLTLSRKRKRL